MKRSEDVSDRFSDAEGFKVNENIIYEVDTTILSQLEIVSEEYEIYGACAFFDEDRKLIEIYLSSGNKIVRPSKYHFHLQYEFLNRKLVVI